MNISELAKHLGISPSTVSRVLSGNAEKYRISATTVARVEKAAANHQVKPDPLGSSLRSGKLGMVGLLVPDITNPFFSGLARAIERKVRDHDLTLQLCDSAESEATESELIDQMLSRRLDGIIVVPVSTQLEAMNQWVKQAPFPVVFVDRVQPGLIAPTVGIDNYEAGRLAASYLIDSGHRLIGCLRGDPESFVDQERFRGVRDVLDAAGILPGDEWISGRGYSLDAGLEGAHEVLGASNPPEALVTLSGQGILAVLQVASELGIQIPNDLSVVAFDEQPWSAFMKPPISTVAQPVKGIASRAVDSLLKSPDEKALPLKVHICERESVRKK